MADAYYIWPDRSHSAAPRCCSPWKGPIRSSSYGYPVPSPANKYVPLQVSHNINQYPTYIYKINRENVVTSRTGAEQQDPRRPTDPAVSRYTQQKSRNPTVVALNDEDTSFHCDSSIIQQECYSTSTPSAFTQCGWLPGTVSRIWSDTHSLKKSKILTGTALLFAAVIILNFMLNAWSTKYSVVNGTHLTLTL